MDQIITVMLITFTNAFNMNLKYNFSFNYIQSDSLSAIYAEVYSFFTKVGQEMNGWLQN